METEDMDHDREVTVTLGPNLHMTGILKMVSQPDLVLFEKQGESSQSCRLRAITRVELKKIT